MPAQVPTQAEFADHEARIAAIERRLNGTPNPPPDPPPDPPPGPPPVAGDLGDFLTVASGEILVINSQATVGTLLIDGGTVRLLPGCDLVIKDIPPSDPEQLNTGIIVQNGGQLIGVGLAPLPDEKSPGRSIVIRSANPSGNRGHVMAHMMGCIDVMGVEFLDLGRTTIARYNDTDNVKGRYAVHLHQLGDEGDCCHIEYCSVHDTIPNSPYRYGITIHSTSKATAKYNLVMNKAGSGIWTEAGDERANAIEGNLVCDVRGTQMPPNPEPDWPASREQLDGDWAFAGNGFAIRSSGNTVRNNTSRRCPIGFLLWFQHKGPFVLARGEFDANLAEDCLYDGLQPWRIGIDDNWTQPSGQSVITNFTVRRCGRYGVYNYYVRNLLYENLTVEDCKKAGYFGGDYHELDLSFTNFTARRCGRGYQPSTMTEGVVRMTGGVMEQNDWADVVFRSLYSSGGSANCQPRSVVLDQVDLRSPTKITMYRDTIEGQNPSLPDQLTYNGRRVYYLAQKDQNIAGGIAPPEAHPEPGIEGLIV